MRTKAVAEERLTAKAEVSAASEDTPVALGSETQGIVVVFLAILYINMGYHV